MIFRPIVAFVFVASCANAPPPPSRTAGDPSNPEAEATPQRVEGPMPSAPRGADAKGDGGVVYACPMHPDVTASEPGHHCPKCGMTLVPRPSAP